MSHYEKLLISALAISGFGLVASYAFAGESPTHCSLATMHGTMAFSGTNTVNGVAHSGSGIESYDGQGHFKYYDLFSDGYTSHSATGTGTYTITSNCVATVIYDGDAAHPWTFFVAADGSRFYYNNNTNTGAIASGQSNRISTAQLIN